MEINNKSRWWFWVRRTIWRHGGYRENDIFKGSNLKMYKNDNVITVESDEGCCYINIDSFTDGGCDIIG